MAVNRPTSSLRLDFVALLVVAVIGIGYYLHKDPMQVAGSNPEVVGAMPPPGSVKADTLLVFGPPPSEEELEDDLFADLDMSMAWYNILTQEVGSFDHINAAALSRSTIGKRRLVVVTSTAARLLSVDQITALGDWVGEGGVLLVEQPTPQWQALLGLSISSTVRAPTRSVTAADGAPLRRSLRDSLLSAPMYTTMRQLTPPGDTADSDIHEVLLEVDGLPAVVAMERDRGHIYATSVDVARAVMTLQQGKPASDFNVLLPQEDTPPALARPWMLSASPKMLENRVPYADLIERNMLETASLHQPLPRWWYFPDRFAGVYVVTHTEDGVGEQALGMTDWEAERRRNSSIFVTSSGLNRDAIGRLSDQGHDIQLQWLRPNEDGEGLAPSGIGSWKPMLVELSIEEQKRSLENRLVRNPVTISRIARQAIDPHWSSTFRKLAAAQIVADSTYGPTTEKQYGYLFGTGLPFYPLDDNGRLIPVAELPFVIRDDHEFDTRLHRRLLTGSESGFHQVVISSFSARSMARNPSVNAIRAWQDAERLAAKHNHWVTTLKDYLLFEEARRGSTFKSEFFPSERRLEVQVNVVKPRLIGVGQEGHRNEAISPSLAIPQTYQGATVESVRVDGTPVPFKKLGRSADGFFHTVPLGPGEHSVHVAYLGRAGDER